MTKRCILDLEENPEEVYLETSSLLLKLVDNVINNPSDSKYRSIRLNNPTVSAKILPAVGAMECLFEMGFQEGDDTLVLPQSISLENLKYMREEISSRRSNYKRTQERPDEPTGEPPKKQASSPHPSTASTSRQVAQVQQVISQNRFLKRVESHFQAVLRYEDKELQSKALKLIPLRDFELAAEKSMRKLQASIKRDRMVQQEFDIQELILMELLAWFKNSFFTWVDSPACSQCKECTEFTGHSPIDIKEGLAQRVEVYTCKKCKEKTLFPRYNDPEKLLETRRGRCGEWANCFTLMCRTLGWEARYIADETDHVWTEIYSGTRKKWLHCDPCENVYNSPLMYEVGWNKKLSYVMAYSSDEVQDVTWRYSCKHREVSSRRTECSEEELLATIVKLRQERQKDLSEARKLYLSKRLLAELVEFLTPRQPTEAEKKGRSSGSLAWRLSRGETEVDITPFVWKPTKLEIDAGKMHIQYSTSRNKYVRNVGQEEVHGWENGIFQVKSVFRKEEQDWKMAYLTRTEGSDTGSVIWKFDMTDSGVTVDSVHLLFSTWFHTTGHVQLKMCTSEMCTLIPGGNQMFETTDFRGCSQLELNAQLCGGEGDNAWQHAQLFRQETTNYENYPLEIIIRFKKL